jgi:hypothetical protein
MLITCRTMTHLATDLSEGKASRYDRFRARFHLLVCPGCRRYHEQLRETSSALTQIRTPGPSEELLSSLREELGRTATGDPSPASAPPTDKSPT